MVVTVTTEEVAQEEKKVTEEKIEREERKEKINMREVGVGETSYKG